MDFDTACTLARRILNEQPTTRWEVLRVERSEARWLVVVRYVPTNETFWLHTAAHWESVRNRS